MRYVAKRFLIALAFAAGFLAVSASQARAGECDLYTTTSGCLFKDGALFAVTAPHPTGTGYIDPFLRIQQNGIEQGFNTDVRPMLCDGVTCDDKTDPNYTHSLLLSEVAKVCFNGTCYREFFLDINEPGTLTRDANLLTLDQIELFQSNDGLLSSYSSLTSTFNTATGSNQPGSLSGAMKVWDMDPAVFSTSALSLSAPNVSTVNTNGVRSVLPSGDNWLNLDYRLVGSGSGSGDMVMFIPDQLFNPNMKYVYLYSQFGCLSTRQNGDCGKTKYGSIWTYQYPSQSGFEEWWTFAQESGPPPSAIPEPGTLTLLATGIAVAARKRRKCAGMHKA